MFRVINLNSNNIISQNEIKYLIFLAHFLLMLRIYILYTYFLNSNKFGRHLDDINKVHHGLPLQLPTNRNNTARTHAEVVNMATRIPATLHKYFEVYMFAKSLQSNDRSYQLVSMEHQCTNRYTKCPLEIK